MDVSTVDYQILVANSIYLMMVDKGYFKGNQNKANFKEKP